MSSTAAFHLRFARAFLIVFILLFGTFAFALTPIVLDISGDEVVYAREFIDLSASFTEMEEGQVERIDDAAHMDVAIGKFYPRLRLIGVRLPKEETPFDLYLQRANAIVANAILEEAVFLSYDVFRYDSDSNYLCYLWFPYEHEGTEVLISANLLLVMNGLCDYVPEAAAGGRLHEYMNQAKDYAKSNKVGFWSEGVNPDFVDEAITHTSEKKTSNRTLSITVTGDFDTPYSGYVEMERSYPNTKIRQEIRGTIPHVHVIELDESWDKVCFNLAVRVYTKSKGKNMTVTTRINNKQLASSSTGPYSPDWVFLFLLSAQYSLD